MLGLPGGGFPQQPEGRAARGDAEACGLEGVVGPQDSVGDCWRKDTMRRERQPGV